MSSQICLKWNSFLNNIATSFESLWEEEGLVDVTLASDGQCLTAHKVILSASSPFFKKVFQTNPCQHPVIILQDVHFSELEALLIFIYKGEVNIEQENLPALLKAAETLQIRGLSGGDIFAKESHKKYTTTQLQQRNNDGNEMTNIVDETSPKKKLKVSKQQNHSILEKALTPRKSRLPSVSESSNSDRSTKDSDGGGDSNQNPIEHPLEMKLEPFEVTAEELQKQIKHDKEQSDRLDTGQNDKIPGTSRSSYSTATDTTSSVASSSLNNPGYSSFDNDNTSRVNNQSPTSATMRNSLISTANCDDLTQPIDGINNNTSYPPFPCPFCDRAYTSWGFRRRHIKAVHTMLPELNCKWCPEILPTHAAWRRHVVSAHNLSASDAHNGLLILEEAHMVLQIAHPTRLSALVDIIKQNSSQSQ